MKIFFYVLLFTSLAVIIIIAILLYKKKRDQGLFSLSELSEGQKIIFAATGNVQGMLKLDDTGSIAAADTTTTGAKIESVSPDKLYGGQKLKTLIWEVTKSEAAPKDKSNPEGHPFVTLYCSSYRDETTGEVKPTSSRFRRWFTSNYKQWKKVL